MKFLARPFFMLILTPLWLSSCGCGSINCAPCETIPHVSLRFDLDSLNGGFRRADVLTAYLVRYSDAALQTVHDTVRQDARRGTIVYWNGNLDNLFLEGYGGGGLHSYRLVVPAAARSYDITDIDNAWEEGGKGCCNCPRVTRRRFRLNGAHTVADGRNAPPTLLQR